jgi:uncharacterized tellurite resistance protein B-like protein
MIENSKYVIKLLYLVAESDNDVAAEETKLIKGLQEQAGVSNRELESISYMTLDDVLERLSVEELRSQISTLIKLLKADGIIHPEELKIFNIIDSRIFEK